MAPVMVELSGKVDTAGILLEDVDVISGDGIAILHLAKGTKALDAQGLPLALDPETRMEDSLVMDVLVAW